MMFTFVLKGCLREFNNPAKLTTLNTYGDVMAHLLQLGVVHVSSCRYPPKSEPRILSVLVSPNVVV